MNEEVVETLLRREFGVALSHARVVAATIVRMATEPTDTDQCPACGTSMAQSFHGISLDVARREVRYDGRRSMALTGREFDLFRALYSARGRPLSKELLMSGLYGTKVFSSGEEPEMKIIDVFVCKTRKKISQLGVTIGTQWGAGYFLEIPRSHE